MKKTKKKYKTQQKTSRTKSRKSRSFAKKILLFAKISFILAIVSVFSLIYFNIDGIIKDWYQFTARLGFSLEHLSVDGQKYTSNDQIGKKLHLKKRVPIFSVSLEDLKNNLESLPWVKHAVVERELPNNIHIYIKERVPLALGQKNRKLYIIDEEGEIIDEKELASHLSLPIIIGDGAEIYASSLIKTLKKDERLFKRVNSVIRVSERRWNVRFDNKLEVKLPEENMTEAWDQVIKLHKNNELFLPDIKSLDLRIANKIYVEKK